MNIAIIGCGYVGTAVAKYWQQQKSVVITATTTTLHREPELQAAFERVEIVRGNNPEGLKSVLENQDIVLLSVGAKFSDSYECTYLQTANTLVSLLSEFPSIKHLIYTSSYAVYGDRNGSYVDEDTPIVPTYSNGNILSKTEEIILSANSGNCCVSIVRLGGIYGPGRELEKTLSSWAGRILPGDGEDITNWIHLDDIVCAIDFIRQNKLQGIYNLVNDAYLTSKEFMNRLCEKHNLPLVIWDNSQKNYRQYNAKVSNQKIKNAGYSLIYPDIIF